MNAIDEKHEVDKTAVIAIISDVLSRLESRPMTLQRYVLSDDKINDMQRRTLFAAVERALGRRLVGQDFVRRE
ncbi:hypothetical protein V1512DRAFT_264739 [Lipomyces arxii]|uniref:uncharacterized protein n=1 Tax=Lipomyces arxii TaxID=56418 RepID=UPI0034CD288E